MGKGVAKGRRRGVKSAVIAEINPKSPPKPSVVLSENGSLPFLPKKKGGGKVGQRGGGCLIGIV